MSLIPKKRTLTLKPGRNKDKNHQHLIVLQHHVWWPQKMMQQQILFILSTFCVQTISATPCFILYLYVSTPSTCSAGKGEPARVTTHVPAVHTVSGSTFQQHRSPLMSLRVSHKKAPLLSFISIWKCISVSSPITAAQAHEQPSPIDSEMQLTSKHPVKERKHKKQS